MTPRLDRLERVRDLRSVWPTEAADFTPWLASGENIKLLGDAVGFDLEVVQAEAAVGPYRADIHCRDTLTGNSVLVENQLERTDHSHLGQLFTYAAGLDAVTVVWIAQRFTEEHRAALDWLNRITHADFRFFGIEIELWKIGDSAHAPKFNVVAKPNEWAKTVREDAAVQTSDITGTRRLNADYWQALSDAIVESGSSIRPLKPSHSSAVAFPIGRTFYSLLAFVSMRDKWVGVNLLIDTSDALGALDALEHDSEAIERELGVKLGEKLVWDRDESRGRQGVHIRIDANPADRGQWPHLHAWTIEKIKAFDRVFRPRVRVLDS